MLEIYDLNGQLLHSEYVAPWSNTKQINLQDKLSNGMYALRLTFGEQTGVVKFVVEWRLQRNAKGVQRSLQARKSVRSNLIKIIC